MLNKKCMVKLRCYKKIDEIKKKRQSYTHVNVNDVDGTDIINKGMQKKTK